MKYIGNLFLSLCFLYVLPASGNQACTGPFPTNTSNKKCPFEGEEISEKQIMLRSCWTEHLHSERYYDGENLLNLCKANINNADLKHLYLRWVNFNDANLNRLNLTGATLIEAQISRARLTNVNLTDAILFSSKISSTEIHSSDLSRANIAKSEIFDLSLV